MIKNLLITCFTLIIFFNFSVKADEFHPVPMTIPYDVATTNLLNEKQMNYYIEHKAEINQYEYITYFYDCDWLGEEGINGFVAFNGFEGDSSWWTITSGVAVLSDGRVSLLVNDDILWSYGFDVVYKTPTVNVMNLINDDIPVPDIPNPLTFVITAYINMINLLFNMQLDGISFGYVLVSVVLIIIVISQLLNLKNYASRSEGDDNG